MGGVLGTLLMLLESSGCGAVLDPALVPIPDGVSDRARWLSAFPSFGYLLSVAKEDAPGVCEAFRARQIACAPVATLDATRSLRLATEAGPEELWDLGQAPLTGFTADADQGR